MKYLELVKGQFTADHEARAKQLEPYVAYSEEAGVVMYTFIPEPVVGPANNEIWYTSKDGNIVTPDNPNVFGVNIVSNTYENGKGIITFDGDVTSIGMYALRGCPITSITIPNSVTSIGFDAFYGCSSLTKTNYTGDIAGWCNINFIDTSSNPITYSHNFYINDQEIKDLVIPNSVTSIENSTFYKCESLTSITIPNSVTTIGESAFFKCTGLTSMTFEGTMEEWNNISKGNKWHYKAPATYVQCSDGQVAL